MRYNLERLGLPLNLEMDWRGRPRFNDPVDGAALAFDALDASSAGALFEGESAVTGATWAGADAAAGAAGAAGADAAAGALDASSGGANFEGETLGGNGGLTAPELASASPIAQDAAAQAASNAPGAGQQFLQQQSVNPENMVGGVDSSSGGANFEGEPVGANGAPTGVGTPKPTGLIDKVINWAQQNPRLAAGVATPAISGAFGAVAGAGKVAAEKAAADAAQQRKKDLLEWQNQFGSVAGLNLKMAPAPAGTVLTRSDGTPVYPAGSKGLIANAVRF